MSTVSGNVARKCPVKSGKDTCLGLGPKEILTVEELGQHFGHSMVEGLFSIGSLHHNDTAIGGERFVYFSDFGFRRR